MNVRLNYVNGALPGCPHIVELDHVPDRGDLVNTIGHAWRVTGRTLSLVQEPYWIVWLDLAHTEPTP